MKLLNKPTSAQKQTEEYLHYAAHIKRLTSESIRTKRIILARFLLQTQCADYRKLTNSQLNEWMASLAKAGKAGKTINNEKQTVVTLVKYLSKQGYSVKLNFENVEHAKEEYRESVYFTPEQVDEIKAMCASPRERLAISLLFDSALRISELRNLRMEDIDGTDIKVIQGKGRKDRQSFITQETRELLDKWVILTGITYGYVFPSPDKYGDPLSLCQIRAAVTPPIRRAGIEKGSAHSLRHSKATAVRNKGGDMVFIQELLGHADINTTRRYVHTTVEQQRQSYEQFA